MSNFRAIHIVFDLHNVLFKPNYRVIFFIFLRIPYKFSLLGYLVNPFFLLRALLSVREEGLGQGSFFKLLIHYPFLSCYESTIVALASAQYPLVGTFEIIYDLQKHYQLHILSNMGVQTFNNLKRNHPECFTYFTTIHHFGPATGWTQKPQAYAYETLLKILGIPPDQMIFIDNSPRNINAAKTLGIQTIRYTSVASLKKSLKKLKLM